MSPACSLTGLPVESGLSLSLAMRSKTGTGTGRPPLVRVNGVF